MNYLSAPIDGPQAPTLVDEIDSRGPIGSAGPSMLREYWQILVRRRWVILAIVLMSVLVGLVVTLLLTPQYTASARVEISRQQQRVTNIEGVEDRDASFDNDFYETQYALLKARSVAERVAKKLRLASKPEFFEGHGTEPAGTELLEESNRP